MARTAADTTHPASDPALERYARQIRLPEIGSEGQRRISDGSVLLIGCGALGSTIANNLVRAGVGLLRIVDRDVLELNNLQRQVLFDEDDVQGFNGSILGVLTLGRFTDPHPLVSESD